jgi:hypothetical protein
LGVAVTAHCFGPLLHSFFFVFVSNVSLPWLVLSQFIFVYGGNVVSYIPRFSLNMLNLIFAYIETNHELFVLYIWVPHDSHSKQRPFPEMALAS